MYNFKEIEKKWQKYWMDNNTFKTDVWDFSKPKYYALDMFPYPSGVGLHAGHVEGYTATDIISRMKRMQGYNVLHPMGYDSFGLPAEQYAIKTGNHPNGFTEKNIAYFTSQLKSLGFDYDWSKEVRTSDPKFYKWTQTNAAQLINFHTIVQGYMPYTEKALMFLFSLNILKIEENGMINISEKNYKKGWDNSIEELNEVFKKAKFLGKWLGIVNDELMIYQHLKIKL